MGPRPRWASFNLVWGRTNIDDMGKRNVEQFNQDVLAAGGYAYTDPARVSARLNVAKMDQIIAGLGDFTNKAVLDIGCGDGISTRRLLDFGASYVLGIDPAEAAVAVARERYGERGRLEFVESDI